MKEVAVLIGAGSIGQAIRSISDTLKAYQYSKRCNVLRVMYEACRWGKRGATINSISPGIIITPLANDELHGPRAKGYLDMIAGMVWRPAVSQSYTLIPTKLLRVFSHLFTADK